MRKLVLVVLAMSLIGGSCPVPNLAFVPLAQTALTPVALTVGSILSQFIDQTFSPALGVDDGG